MNKTIYMGQFDTARTPDTLKTTLGSCVGVVLYDPFTDIFGMAHVMLPGSNTQNPDTDFATTNSGRYVETALPALIALMGTPAQQSSRLRAKIAGGANMFGNIPQNPDNSILQVGLKNIETTKALLQKLGIPILGEDIGGIHGRELTVDTGTGKVWVRTIGDKAKEL